MMVFFIFAVLQLIQVSTQNILHPRIINGDDAKPNEFPFMASLQLSSMPLLPYFHVCCGTVYNDYWILSSAVCVKTINMTDRARVVIDMHFTYKKDKNVQIFKIARKIVHEDFSLSSKNWSNDIGLVKLKTAIIKPRPAKLSQPKSMPMGEVVIIGWGRTSKSTLPKIPKVLKYAKAIILTNKQCQLYFIRAKSSFIVQNSHICINSPIKYVTGMKGDAGGPVVQYINGEPEIVGLLSVNLYPSNKGNSATVNTRISYFIDWIDENIKETVDIR